MSIFIDRVRRDYVRHHDLRVIVVQPSPMRDSQVTLYDSVDKRLLSSFSVGLCSLIDQASTPVETWCPVVGHTKIKVPMLRLLELNTPLHHAQVGH